MKTKNLAFRLGLAGVLAGLVGFACPHEAQAVNQVVGTSVTYDTALSVTVNTGSVDFGIVEAGINGATYSVDTTGALTTGGGGNALGGTPNAADFTIVGSTTQTVVIGVVGYGAANNGTTASAARCAYNGGAEAACSAIGTVAAPGAGKTLLVGATVTSDGTAAAGVTATPNFTLSFVYS